VQLLFLGISCFLLQVLPHLLNLAPLLPLRWSTLLAPMWSKFYFSWKPTKFAFGSTFSTSSPSTVFVTSASSPSMFLINLQCINSSILIHSNSSSLYIHTSQQPAPVQSSFVFGSINSIRREPFPVWQTTEFQSWVSIKQSSFTATSNLEEESFLCFSSCSKLGAFNLYAPA